MRQQRLVRRRQFTNAALAGALAVALEARSAPVDAVPRRRHVSAATQEAVYRNYYAQLRLRIQDFGTTHYPTVDGRRLSGQVSLDLTVDPQGRLVAAQVVQGSGSTALDGQALSIARSAAPFGPFNDAMRRVADLLVVRLDASFDPGSGVSAMP